MNADPLQFVDTDVLIYAHDSSAGSKHEQARALLRDLWRDRAGTLSSQVLQEFYVNVTRNVAHPLVPEVAAQVISDLTIWQVHRSDVSDALEAIRIQIQFQISFWDAMILTSARRLGCKIVWSENLSHGQVYEQVQVRNPFE